MFKSNLRIAWRNMRRDLRLTVLNGVGLSVGLACSLLIGLWIADELRVDKFHEKDRRLYQVMQLSKGDDASRVLEMTPAPLAEALPKELPGVEYAASVISPDNRTGVLSAGERQVRATEQYVGKDFFNIFSYPLLQGDRNEVLADKSSVVLSDELAKKLFSTPASIIGKTLTWNDEKYSGTFRVSGIFKKPPRTSTAQFDVLFPFDVYLDHRPDANHWEFNDPNTYIVLKNGVDPAQFSKKLSAFLQRKTGQRPNESLFIRRYSDKYLYANYENGVQAGGRIEYVRIFTLIAVFILVIACINFMNLSTARAARRLKEVGIKKVVGASRGSLILQYLTESMLMTILSFILAVVFVRLLLPFFGEVTGKQLALRLDLRFLCLASAMCLVTGLVAGGYPAFYISGFNPVAVLKGKLKTSIGELWVRKGLVVFQFTISVFLIVSVIVVYRQVAYIRSKNLGFDKDNTIVLKKDGLLNSSAGPFLRELRNRPEITDASMFAGDLIHNITGTDGVSWPGKPPEKKVVFKYLFVGHGFIETLGIKMQTGQTFSRALGPDSSQIIFNQAAIDAMGLKDPVGKIVSQWGQDKRIVGVVKDFHFQSLYESVKPCFLILSPDADVDNIAIRVRAGKEKEAIADIRQSYLKYNPGFPFEFKFLDRQYQALYESEERVGVLSGYFAAIAIIISCLGLFGLAAFTAQRRQKEIGVRKVVGASVGNITMLLSQDFLRLVLLSLVIAFPIAGWAANQWLHGFAYRIDLGADIFLVAGVATILLTLLAISFQAVKAALANPVKSLRTE